MKLYCQIEQITKEDGTTYMEIVEGPCELPQNSKHISNLNVLDDQTLKMFGWVPVEQQSNNKEVFVSVSYEILEDKVIQNTVNRDKTEKEISSEEESRNNIQWQQIRRQRNELLADSDKLVLIDRWEQLSDEQKIKITLYRKVLRDLPAQYINPSSVIFPTL